MQHRITSRVWNSAIDTDERCDRSQSVSCELEVDNSLLFVMTARLLLCGYADSTFIKVVVMLVVTKRRSRVSNLHCPLWVRIASQFSYFIPFL